MKVSEMNNILKEVDENSQVQAEISGGNGLVNSLLTGVIGCLASHYLGNGDGDLCTATKECMSGCNETKPGEKKDN